MRIYGLASAAEFLGDQIVFRNLEPQDADLPGLRCSTPRLGLPAGRIPRKHELDYARVVAHVLKAARQRQSDALLRRLVFIGDTDLLDGTAFANLCQVTGWNGLAFIGAETAAPPAVDLKPCPGGALYLANRWESLLEFDLYCAQAGLPVDEQTAVVIDLDKTILGARGRNGGAIDRARSTAMEQTISALLQGRSGLERFQPVYRLFNQAEFHPFTSDNQDYLAYVCWMVLADVVEASALAESVRRGEVASFDQFIAQMDTRRGEFGPEIAQAHNEVYACVQAGDPTPFKAFRRNEYLITFRAMGCMPEGSSLAALLENEIVLTQEVRQMALEWKNRGALVFGLSDKPDEAAVPNPALAEQGYLPLHRVQTHAVGS